MANLKQNSVDGICCIRYASSSIKCCALGASVGGGCLLHKSGGMAIIVAPVSTVVVRSWYAREDAVTVAKNTSPYCQDWYIPDIAELVTYTSPLCTQYYDTCTNNIWSSTDTGICGWLSTALTSCCLAVTKTSLCNVRAFRRVLY